MLPLKIKQSPASIQIRIEKLYQEYCLDCILSDQVKHFIPYLFSNFRPSKRYEKQKVILNLRELMEREWPNLSWQEIVEQKKEFLVGSLEDEFFDILMLEGIVEVERDRTKFTLEENQQIDVICYCNYLHQAVIQERYIPCNISLPEELSGENFSLIIFALESYRFTEFDTSIGWASLAAAFLLTDIIKTNVDLSEKFEEDIDDYWHKRYHDAISFAIKAVKFTPAIKESADMLLFHIKAVAGEDYPDIKQRINILEIEPNIQTFKYFKRDPVQALLHYPRKFLEIKLPYIKEELFSQNPNAQHKPT